MVITKTPLRMSFFGGGTDLEDYFRRNGGAVLSTAVDRYCYVAVRHRDAAGPGYSPAEDEAACPAVRGAMELLDIRDISLAHHTDLPTRSGLGTSSAFAVGLLHALHALRGEHAGPRQLAEEAIFLERTMCREAGGWQDQVASAYGGLNRIDFGSDGYRVRPIPMEPTRKAQLNRSLLLFFTGVTRISSDIQRECRVEENAALLGQIYTLVEEAESILLDSARPLEDFGKLLDRAWALKRQTGKGVSTDWIDRLYRQGIQAGAEGGKLLGAGGGGFLLFYVRPERQSSVRRALWPLREVPFRFEENGTRLLEPVSRREERLCVR